MGIEQIDCALAVISMALVAFVAAVGVPVLVWSAICVLDGLGEHAHGWDLLDLTESRTFRVLWVVCALGIVACGASIAVLGAVALGMGGAL